MVRIRFSTCLPLRNSFTRRHRTASWESLTLKGPLRTSGSSLSSSAKNSTGTLSACTCSYLPFPLPWSLRFCSRFVCTYICSVGIVNEILWGTIGQTAVQSFYFAAYESMRTSRYVLVLRASLFYLAALTFRHQWNRRWEWAVYRHP